MREENAPFTGILAVLLLTVGTWLGYEYLNAAPLPSPTPATGPLVAARADGVTSGIGEPSSGPTQLPVRQEVEAGGAPAQPPANAGAIHKCWAQGQIEYSDLPCDAGAGIKTFKPTLAAAASLEAQRIPAPSRPASRSPRAVQPAEQAAVADTAANKTARRRAECKRIDEAIAAIDARLRQPYYPQEGDRLKDERKALTARRFSPEC